MPLFDDRMIGCLANNPLIQPLRRWRGPREHGPPLTVEVSHDLVVRLRPEARRRDVPLKRLVRDLLDAVGEEPGLAAAILDDGEPRP
jgi:hypothetical protein